MPNEQVFYPVQGSDLFSEKSGVYESVSLIEVGQDNGNMLRGAVRFPNVNVGRVNINRAGLLINSGLFTGSGNFRSKVYGIDEDNVGALSGGNPYGRFSKTTSSASIDKSLPTSDEDLDVTGPVQEILNRSGWSSGNALGLFWEDNGSDNNNYYYDAITTTPAYIKLSIRVNNPNLKPTPKSASTPAFPTANDYGVKISKAGVDVKTASEADLLLTTKKNKFKTHMEGEIVTTATEHKIPHNLGYAPVAIAFALFNGKRYVMPQIGFSGGGNIGFFSTDSTWLYINCGVGVTVYYYIFLEPQPS